MKPRSLALLVLLAASMMPVAAQEYPSRAITLVVPYTAGGPVDTVGRVLAAGLAEVLGQQVVVENVGGAGGMIGSARVAYAPPDGYTVLQGGSAVLAINHAMYKRPLVDGAKDFKLVSLFSDQARVLVVRKDFPATTLAEFNAYVKANHRTLQYGTSGAGSGTHVCALMLDAINGTKVTHVSYRGSAQAMQDLIGGRLDFITEQISTAIPLVEAGSVRAIAVLGEERSTALPNLPTAKEQGIEGLDCGAWGALALPKGTPDAVAQKLAEATNKVVELPFVRERFKQMGVTVPARERRTMDYLSAFVPAEIERWGKVIKTAGISLE